MNISTVLDAAVAGRRPGLPQAAALVWADLPALAAAAAAIRDAGHGEIVTYSRKVFIPLTRLCRDVCHYCTFAIAPRQDAPAYVSPDEAVAIAQRGADAGCREALFTLGDKPELRWQAAREALAALGFASTLAYLRHVAERVHRETGLLPHLNPGLMTDADLAMLRPVSASMGIMLESAAERLCEKGGPHYGSPDKHPAHRLATIAAAGAQAIPFTSGLLIGIGETRHERIAALLALRDLHDRHGHIQEIIIQNFRPKPGTRMAATPPAPLTELLWTIAAARVLFGSEMNIQAPPNLAPDAHAALIGAGINDWGGVSPVTIDHVNPEAPWPEIALLSRHTQAAGKILAQRLTIYPPWARDGARWLDPAMRPAVLHAQDAAGYAREDQWRPGTGVHIPRHAHRPRPAPSGLQRTLDRARGGVALTEDEVVSLFSARGADADTVCAAADALRRDTVGGVVRYVVTRNINYTNVCTYGCRFCAFSKGRTHDDLRGHPYDLDMAEFGRRVTEAWARGGTEICLQGGIHPDYTGHTYLRLLHVAKQAAPDIHIHAFSPLEIWQGARTLDLSLQDYLRQLKAAGLASLPGTAAEILDDAVRAILCPDKINTAQWFAVMQAAHAVGLRSTATIMFGHVDTARHWARHLLRLRAHQAATGGFTELVPLPFVAHEAPIFRKNQARPGPTWREALLMHAVARLALHPVLTNIQTSWVKMGPDGAAACLAAGANDLGGTLMNESITRAAGAIHGQELPPREMEALIRAAGRTPQQRTTLYGVAPADRVAASFAAAPLRATVNTKLGKRPLASAPVP